MVSLPTLEKFCYKGEKRNVVIGGADIRTRSVFKMVESTACFYATGSEGVERNTDEWKNEGMVKPCQKQNHRLGEGMGCTACMGVARSRRRATVGTGAREAGGFALMAGP